VPLRPSAESLPEPATLLREREESGWSTCAPTLDEPEGDVAPVPALVADERGRYEPGPLLGKGGMGEVWACTDRRIGREVAMKVVRPERGRADPNRARFLHEARVQARLEHPAIVPVYDLGLGPEGDAFFTMKRVRGRTLAEVLGALAAGDAETRASFGWRKLLGAFGQVCLAVDYAHAQGVVHRDLKPGNVMLGDFGEVHVLDWGLAKIRDAEPSPASGMRPRTELGQVLGTPGYMAPEQTVGLPVDARTDVYALGEILREIVTLERRVDPSTRGERAERARGALSLVPDAPLGWGDGPPPPELLAVCDRALAIRKEDRFPSARALWQEVERTLDGDRDLALRRARADEHARAATTATARALEGDTPSHTARRRALREVGRALALDPGHAGARRALVQLLVEPPAALPVEVEREIRESALTADRASGVFGMVAFVYILMVAPLGYLMGVRDPFVVAAFPIAIALAAVVRLVSVVRPGRSLRGVVLLASSAAFALLAGLFGPFLFVPGLLAANTVSYALSPVRWLRIASVIVGLLSILVPWGLELAGVLPPSYSFEGGALVVHSHLAPSLPAGPTTGLLLLTSLGLVLLPVLFVGQTGRALSAAERRVALHAWQMRQLVADEQGGGPVAASTPCEEPSRT